MPATGLNFHLGHIKKRALVTVFIVGILDMALHNVPDWYTGARAIPEEWKENSVLSQTSEGFRKSIVKAFPTNPKYEGHFFIDILPGSLGRMGGLFAFAGVLYIPFAIFRKRVFWHVLYGFSIFSVILVLGQKTSYGFAFLMTLGGFIIINALFQRKTIESKAGST